MEKSKRYYWRYDYEGCPKNGPFKSQQQAITDAAHSLHNYTSTEQNCINSRQFRALLDHMTRDNYHPMISITTTVDRQDPDDYLTQYQQLCDYCIVEGMCYDVEVGNTNDSYLLLVCVMPKGIKKVYFPPQKYTATSLYYSNETWSPLQKKIPRI